MASPFLCFYAAVALSAGFGGLAPGLLATAASALAAHLLFAAPNPPHAIHVLEAVHLVLFATAGCIISALSHHLRRRFREAESAREEAERSRRRIEFLARAGATLDASLDYTQVLGDLAHIAVPYLADWCTIDIVGEDGSLTPAAYAHVDPAKEVEISRLASRYPPDPQGQHPVRKVLVTGQSDIHLDIPESALVAAARDDQHLAALRSLNIRSYVCAPLRGREGMLGAILFVSSARHRYSEADRELADDLARRAALAVDNSRLYHEAQEEIEERKRAEQELARQQEQVKGLNERLKRSVVETHHRVKNNLQIITAMVDMRLMDGGETVSVDEVRRVKAYIQALAAVHDILTQQARSDDGDEATADQQEVSVKSVLEKLLPLMQETAGGRRIDFTLEDARLPARQGASVALIVNELVSNAVKYGRSEVRVDMRVVDAERAVVLAGNGHKRVHTGAPPDGAEVSEGTVPRVALLQVRDDGPGFPPDFDPVKAANTGLDLIDNLSRWDLGGGAAFENRVDGGGAVVTITIPLAP